METWGKIDWHAALGSRRFQKGRIESVRLWAIWAIKNDRALLTFLHTIGEEKKKSYSVHACRETNTKHSLLPGKVSIFKDPELKPVEIIYLPPGRFFIPFNGLHRKRYNALIATQGKFQVYFSLSVNCENLQPNSRSFFFFFFLPFSECRGSDAKHCYQGDLQFFFFLSVFFFLTFCNIVEIIDIVSEDVLYAILCLQWK